MQKIKTFFKKKYALCLMVLLIFCMGISLTYNKKVVLGANTIIEEGFVYVLPQVIVSTNTSIDCISPSMYLGFNDDGSPFIYTMTGSNPANNLRYVRRNFSFVSGSTYQGIYNYTWNPFVLFGGNGDSILSSSFTGEQTGRIIIQRLSLDMPIFSEGSLSVTTSATGVTTIRYSMLTSEPDSEPSNTFDFTFTIVNDTNSSGENQFNYTASFYPTLIALSPTGDITLNAAFEEGRKVGLAEGKAIGKQEGLNQANVFTFSNLISAVIDVPINSFKSLLNFNFLDINMLDFALSIITLFVVIKIVGVINGKA